MKIENIKNQFLRPILLCLLYLLISSAPLPVASAAEDAVCPLETCFEERKMVNGKNLFLGGVAFFKKAFFRIYEVGLYVPRGIHNERQVLSNQVPKTVVVEYDRDIDARELFDDFQKNLSANQAGDEILKNQFIEIVSEVYPIRGGERHEFVFEPGQGTTIVENGKSKMRIPGDRFARSFFGFWLNRHNNGNQLLRAKV